MSSYTNNNERNSFNILIEELRRILFNEYKEVINTEVIGILDKAHKDIYKIIHEKSEYYLEQSYCSNNCSKEHKHTFYRRGTTDF